MHAHGIDKTPALNSLASPPSLADDFMRLAQKIADATDLPVIKDILIAPPDGSHKSGKFGAMTLADGSIGLTYVALDGAWQALFERAEHRSLIGQSPLTATQWLRSEHPWQRALAVAAINAISHLVFKRARHLLSPMKDTVDLLDLSPGDHVGMVGHFNSVIESIRKTHTDLSVIELNPELVQSSNRFEVTLDPSRLSHCNKWLCTGTTLINGTLPALLQYRQKAESICVIGPTASCLPDPLFARGVHVVGGSLINDTDEFLARWRAGQRWRDLSTRYQITRHDYPGIDAILAEIQA